MEVGNRAFAAAGSRFSGNRLPAWVSVDAYCATFAAASLIACRKGSIDSPKTRNVTR